MRAFLLFLFLYTTATAAEKYPSELLAALTKCPWPGQNYPALPNPSERVLDFAGNEMAHSKTIRQAVDDLNPNNSNVSWFAAEDVLEREHAVWCLQACLCHPHEDVQIHAVRALSRLKDVQAVPFLLIFAEYEDMPFEMMGSENVTIHGILISDIESALATLTGVPSSTNKKDEHSFTTDILRWRRWQADHPPAGA